LIELINVSRSFDLPNGKRLTVLSEVSLSIESGRSLAILGRSGAGKSTLLQLIGLLDYPDTGRYLLNDVDVAESSEKRRAELRASLFGFVFQDYQLPLNREVWEIVSQPLLIGGQLRGRRERAAEVLSLVGLEDHIDSLPSKMSGGEAQRVAIARALVSNPTYIIADEPTGNLDQATATRVIDRMFAAAREASGTLVVVTDDHVVAGRCDRVVSIDHGSIRENA